MNPLDVTRRKLLAGAATGSALAVLGCAAMPREDIERYRRVSVVSTIGDDFAVGQAVPSYALLVEQAPRIDIRAWNIDAFAAERVIACVRATSPNAVGEIVDRPPPELYALLDGGSVREERDKLRAQGLPSPGTDALVLLRKAVGGLPPGYAGGRTWGLGMMDGFGIPARRFAIYANFLVQVLDGPGLDRFHPFPAFWGTIGRSQAELDEQGVRLRVEPRENLTPERLAIVAAITRRLVQVGVDDAMGKLGFTVPASRLPPTPDVPQQGI